MVWQVVVLSINFGVSKIFVEAVTHCIQDSLMNIKSVTFDEFSASLLNKKIHFFQKKKYY